MLILNFNRIVCHEGLMQLCFTCMLFKALKNSKHALLAVAVIFTDEAAAA